MTAREGRGRSQESKRKEMSLRFIEQAHGDLRVAQMLVQPGGYHAAVEEARLATELALKAVLWLRKGQGTKGHDVARLPQQVQRHTGPAPKSVGDSVYLIGTATTGSRYPDAADVIPLHRFAEADALKCIKAAGLVVTWADEVAESGAVHDQ